MDPDITESVPLLEAQPSRLISQVAALVTRSTGAALEALGAHKNHFAVLAVLEVAGPLSQADLSRRTHIDRSDMVAALDRLEHRGAVSRSVDAGDRRRNVVVLTEAGKAWLQQLSTALAAAQQEAFAALSADELVLLRAMLMRIRDDHRGRQG